MDSVDKIIRRSKMKKYIDLLGMTGTDKITGQEGVITSISFDLYGCIQGVLTPPAKEGEVKGGNWFDIARIEITPDVTRVMDLPDFDQGYLSEANKGPADKPLK